MVEKIILIEGPDSSGKSYLANQIMQKYPNHVYMHNAVTSDIKALHTNTVEAASLASFQHTVIIDRLHLSEKIYGTLFRDGPSYDISEIEQMLDNIDAKHHNVIKILCLVDKETSVKIHDSRQEIEMFNDNTKVWDAYAAEAKNLSADWKVYNWKTDDLDLTTFNITKKTT